MVNINELGKQRIRMLADLIEHEDHVIGFYAEKGFCMSYVTHDCGTPSCIVGYAMKAAEADPTFDARPNSVLPHSYWIASSYLHGDDCVMSLNHFSRLFDPDTPRHFSWNLITPAHAATALRNLADTGIIDWSHAWKDREEPATSE